VTRSLTLQRGQLLPIDPEVAEIVAQPGQTALQALAHLVDLARNTGGHQADGRENNRGPAQRHDQGSG